MKKASIINFKGGVGKTTLSFHLACHLAENARVLVVDVDHQSSLSIVILGSSLWERHVSANNTINRVFESFCNRRIEMPRSEIIIKHAFGQRGMGTSNASWYPNLDVACAQFELDDTEIDLASTTYGNANLSDWEKRTLLADWLDRIDAAKHYDYVIFDCPPATKIMSQNALACSNCYIIPVIPDSLSSRGVSHFHGLVQNKIDKKLHYLKTSAHVDASQTPKNYVAKTSMAAIVPFLIKTAGRAVSGYANIHTEELARLRGQWNGSVTKNVGKNYIGVPEAVNAGWPVWNHWGNNAKKAIPMMRGICSDLKARIDAS
jgi:chromosome partitioning protein